MLFAHPDDILTIAKERQAELRREIAADRSTSGARPPGWLPQLARLIWSWPPTLLRPNTLPEDAIWPELRNYPCP
jgi:hypothetical protein